MHRCLVIVAWLVAANCSIASNGIVVGDAKVYDDYFLQTQLNVTKSRLMGLQVLDQTTLLGHLGTSQGGTLQQSSLSLQLLGAATPQVVTSLPASSSVAPAAANTQVTTQNALTPSIPAPVLSSLTLPTTISPSALETLNEQMQLSYEITNYELLLNGAISDRFLTDKDNNTVGKIRLTIGFPITIDAPQAEHANEVAEVEVTVCNHDDSSKFTEKPSIVTLLPQEHTYNVMSLTDNSQSFGLGVIANVFSVNAGWFSGNKTYYLVKQQDTVALQKVGPNNACANGSPSVIVSWQFFPSLGGKFVRSGMRQTFLQLAVPPPGTSNVAVDLVVRSMWRPLGHKSGVIKEATEVSEPRSETVHLFSTTPRASAFAVLDLGAGNLLVRAKGVYLQGLRARLGSTYLDMSTPGFASGPEFVQFVASGQALAATGAYLVGTDGSEYELKYDAPAVQVVNKDEPLIDLRARQTFPPDSIDCSTKNESLFTGLNFLSRVQTNQVNKVSPEKEQLIERIGSQKDQVSPALLKLMEDSLRVNRRLSVGDPSFYPRSTSATVVTIPITEWSTDTEFKFAVCQQLPFIVTIGGKLFGLSDAPFYIWRAQRAEDSAINPTNYEVSVVVNNDALLANPLIRAQHLFMGPAFQSEWHRFAAPNQFAVQKLTVVSTPGADKTAAAAPSSQSPGKAELVPKSKPMPPGGKDNDVVLLAIGSGMWDSDPQNRMTLYAPAVGKDARVLVEVLSPTAAIVRIAKTTYSNLKQLVFKKGLDYVAIALPEDNKASSSASSAPKLDNAKPIPPGTAQLSISGSNLDQVAAIAYLHQRLNFALTTDGKTLVVDLPTSFISTEGIRYLDLIDSNRTSSRYKVLIQAKNP